MSTVFGGNTVAAKRTRPDGGDQDFGFLSSGNEAETESASLALDSTESSSGSPAAAFDQFNKQVDSEQPDFDKATRDAVTSPAAAPTTAASAAPLTTLKSAVPSPPSVPVSAVADSNTAQPVTTTAAQVAATSSSPVVSQAIESPIDSESTESPTSPSAENESRKGGSSTLSIGLLGYAIALTLLLVGLIITGRLSLTGNAVLESLPDLRPLAPNEFRKIEDGAELPKGHVLKMGESRRFGDVVVTPVKLTKEPLKFQGFLSGKVNEKLTSQPVLKLWLNFESVADDYAYPPFDAGLMSNRTPPFSRDATTLANSFLTIFTPSQDSATTRKLNYLHTMDDNFVIVDQNSAKVLERGESMMTFIAASENDNDPPTDESTQFVWRIQFRKGVNVSSGNGVTTLIDVKFSGADIDKAG